MVEGDAEDGGDRHKAIKKKGEAKGAKRVT